jgi:hypothetical protein
VSMAGVGWLPAVGTGYWVMVPAVVIRPILLPWDPVNHSAPSGPEVFLEARYSPSALDTR